MQNSSNIISSIYKARQTIIALMRKLDYNVSDYEHFSVNEVNTMFQNKQMDMLLEKSKEDPRTGRKNKIYILFYLAKAIRPANIQEMIDDLFILTETLKKTDTLFIIIKDEPNETIINELKHIWESEGIFIIIENIKRLQFNILKHVLVPPHRVMSEKEVKDVIWPLGMVNVRYKRLCKMTDDFVTWNCDDATELYGIGKYGSDSYEIFFKNSHFLFIFKKLQLLLFY
jgi:hypothetical protein